MKTSNRTLRIFITVIAFCLIVTHLVFPNLAIDAVTVVLVVLALLPWLSPLIRTVELPGGIKLELNEIKHELDEVKGAASSAETKAAYAIAQKERDGTSDASRIPQQTVQNRYERLAQIYNEIRATQKPGPARTDQMTKLVSDMATLVPLLENFDIDSALNSQNAGTRLSAYTYLYVMPSIDKLSRLVNSVIEYENTPFGQYWGIQAIGSVLNSQSANMSIDQDIITRLWEYLSRLEPGTDRHYELNRLLQAYS